MGQGGDRRTSWLAACLLVESWACVNAGQVLPLLQALSMRGFLGMAPLVFPGWLAPTLLGAAAAGLVLALVLLAFRLRLAPLAVTTWWQTRYLLVIGISSLLLGLAHLRAFLSSSVEPREFLTPEFHGVYRVGACLFLTTAMLPLAAWLARRRGSRFAGTLTASAHLALAAFVPNGLIPLTQWLQNVRRDEEGTARLF